MMDELNGITARLQKNANHAAKVSDLTLSKGRGATKCGLFWFLRQLIQKFSY